VQPKLIVIVFVFFLQGILQGIAAANASPHRVIVGVILPKKRNQGRGIDCDCFIFFQNLHMPSYVLPNITAAHAIPQRLIIPP